MKKTLSFLLALLMVISLCACGDTSTPATDDTSSPEQSSEPVESVVEEEPVEEGVAFEDLEIGDEVHVIGQKANATLVNDNTIWVQVVETEKRTVVYHCQMLEEYISEAEAFDMLDVVEVKGKFMSITDMEQENTAIIVTLYDCELV